MVSEEPYPLGTQGLPPEIAVVDGTDVDALWEPFRFYEAGHFRQTIMNPLNSDGLDLIVEAIAVQPGERVLDIACGHGELLARLKSVGDRPVEDRSVENRPAENRSVEKIVATGVDLSPWTIRRAHHRLGPSTTLLVGDGERYMETTTGVWDVITLIGAPWIWGGFKPAAAALIDRLAPGGRLAIGDVVAAGEEAKQRLGQDYGNPLTDEEQQAALAECGLGDLRRITSSAEDWRRYDDDVLEGLNEWAELFPDDQPFVDRGEASTAGHDPADAAWQVWIGTLPA